MLIFIDQYFDVQNVKDKREYLPNYKLKCRAFRQQCVLKNYGKYYSVHNDNPQNIFVIKQVSKYQYPYTQLIYNFVIDRSRKYLFLQLNRFDFTHFDNVKFDII